MLAYHAQAGGAARAEALSPKRRKAIAKRAATARWEKHRKGRWPLVKGRQDWATPPALFAALNREFHFTLDVAASAVNAKCSRYFTEQDNGLVQPWAPARVWCNPPYDPAVLSRFVEKGYQESQRGALVVLLVPARTDVRWWHQFAMKGEVRFLPGRVRFVLPDRSSSSSPFPSAIVIFKNRATAK